MENLRLGHRMAEHRAAERLTVAPLLTEGLLTKDMAPEHLVLADPLRFVLDIRVVRDRSGRNGRSAP